MTTVDPVVPRLLPPLDDANRAFWTGGADGQLMIQRCAACREWVHPPVPSCPSCAGALAPEAVSGTGTVYTFTVNHQQYHPDVPLPYVIAIVELDDQAGLRLPTNIVGCDPDDVVSGMAVAVVFEPQGDVYVPLFSPRRASLSGGRR